MATRSIIGVEQADGSVRAVRCFLNGWPDGPYGVGYNLATFYADAVSANDLVDMGSMSMIGPSIGEKAPLDEDDRPVHDGHDQCVFYYRDWEQEELELYEYADVADFCRTENYDTAFAYLFRLHPRNPEAGDWTFSHCAHRRLMPAEPRVLTDGDLAAWRAGDPEPVACLVCGLDEPQRLRPYDSRRRVCGDCWDRMYPRPEEP